MCELVHTVIKFVIRHPLVPGPLRGARTVDQPTRAESRQDDDAFRFALMTKINRHLSDTEVVGRDLPSLGVPRQRNSIAADSLKAKTARCPPRWAETRCFVFIKAYLCRRRLWHLTSSPGHVGAGGARSWAINIRISWNICRGTATSAIWNVT
jgi:hypothetical protein